MGTKPLERNTTLDLIKFIASYFVVFIHVPFTGEFGIVIETIARFAVPVFFISSGFFGYNNDLDKIKKKIKNVLVLFLSASILYNCYNVVMYVLSETRTLNEYIRGFFDFSVIVKLLLLNCTYSSSRLWFLVALIYVYGVYYIIQKYHVSERLFLLFSFSCLIIHLVLGEVFLAFGIIVPYILIRNFLFMGIPFFGIGMVMKKHENIIYKASNNLYLVLIVCGSIIAVASRYIIGRNELYFGSAITAIAITMLAIKMKDKKYPVFIKHIASCSTGIYIFHKLVEPFVVLVIKVLFPKEMSGLIGFFIPIMTCIVSTVGAYFFDWFLKYFKKKKTENLMQNA